MAVSTQNPISLQHYRALPAEMYEVSDPTPAKEPVLLELNHRLLAEYGLEADWFESADALRVLSGSATIPELQENSEFIEITAAGVRESHSHDVKRI